MALGPIAVIALLAAVRLPISAPPCIAAVTVVPSTSIASGQTVTFTDGTLVNPATRFISRTWTFGDGSATTSTQVTTTDAVHTYVNRTGRTLDLTVRLTERTGLGTCTTMLALAVGSTRL
ncbi:MAG: PKD domain-containing protein [Candidatus Tyrphobacter sp.]